MKKLIAVFLILPGFVLLTCPVAATGKDQSASGLCSIGATGKNIEAIVRAFGGDQVDTFSLFKGCILRSDLTVTPGASDRLATADAFTESLNADIERWKKQLAGLADMRIFPTLCGCQNLTELGGPNLAVYKSTPGSLPDIGNLIDPLKRIEVDVVVIDPSISSEDRNALLRETSMSVVEIPSCIESIQGARTYSALLDNLIDTLRKYKEKGAPG